MKTIRALLLGLLMLAGISAAAAWRPRPLRRVPRIPWDTIVAGGAAAGTVIAAYKISDGVEDGLKTVARSNPEAFASTLSVFPRLCGWGTILLLIGGGYVLWRRYRSKEKSFTNQGERRNE